MFHCEECGATFVPNRTQKYCSVKCRRKSERKRAKARGYKRPCNKSITYTCNYCGKDYHPKSAERNQYCSRECSFADKEKRCDCGESIRGSGLSQCFVCSSISVGQYVECEICGNEFETFAHNQKYCSDECVKEKNRQWYHDNFVSASETNPYVTKVCEECGAEYKTNHMASRRKYCSKDCAKAVEIRNQARGNHQQRAKHYGVHYEWFVDTYPMRRDGWYCYICGIHTPRKLKGSIEHNAPEVDHVVPLSRGGTHTRDNVKCSCRHCNLLKSDMKLDELEQAHTVTLLARRAYANEYNANKARRQRVMMETATYPAPGDMYVQRELL